MNSTFLLSLVLTLVPADDLSYKGTTRQPNPLAPSLPLLTDEEYAEITEIIDRFIQADIGKLKGVAGRKALSDLQGLGPEAVFPLIEGFNKAANLQHSCPAVIIGRKLARILDATQDIDLLDFARENLGAEVKATRHTVVIKDLRVGCMLRKTAVQRIQATASLPGQKPLRSMAVADLVSAAGKEKGANLKKVLVELERRGGRQAFDTLAIAAAGPEKDAQPLARSLLARHLYRQSTTTLKAKLQDDSPEIRVAAVTVVGSRKLPWGFELINLLGDADMRVVQSARRALVGLAKGSDFGPEPTASTSERDAAASRWREWWSKRSSKR